MYLHSKKSMHCDIKEANVMISGDTDWQAPIPGFIWINVRDVGVI